MCWFLLRFGTLSVTHRNKLCAKYKASPIIRLMVVSAGPPSNNFLLTPYEGGYPDTAPKLVTINKSDGHVSRRERVLISWRASCKELWKFFEKEHADREVSLGYQKVEFDFNEMPLPEDDFPFTQTGFGNLSVLKLILKAKREEHGMEEIEESKAVKEQKFPILQEEYFEDVGDESMGEFDEDISAEMRKEEEKRAKEKEKAVVLEQEFEKQYHEHGSVETTEFSPLGTPNIVRNLESLLNSYDAI